MNHPGPLLTSTQAGVLLNKSGRTVVRLARAGRINVALELPGANGALLFDPAEIQRYAAEHNAPKAVAA